MPVVTSFGAQMLKPCFQKIVVSQRGYIKSISRTTGILKPVCMVRSTVHEQKWLLMRWSIGFMFNPLFFHSCNTDNM